MTFKPLAVSAKPRFHEGSHALWKLEEPGMDDDGIQVVIRASSLLIEL